MILPGISELFWTAGKAFLISLILTPIARDIFRSYNVVDRPGRRKVHAYPIPRIGGIAIAIAYAIALLSETNAGASITRGDSVAWRLIPGAATIFLTGLLDDFFTFRPVFKLAGEVIAAVLIYTSGLRVETIANVDLPWWISLPVTLFWLLLATNALNLIDGLDGLCTGIGLMATLTLSGAAVIHGNQPLALATIPLTGALLGFFFYNFNPATVFLGDSGALLIGFLLGCYGMIWTQKTDALLSIAVPLLALSIPLLDVSLSIARRYLRNKPIFSADRGHIHHRLLSRGLSVRGAVLVLYLVAGVAAGFALLLSLPGLGKYRALIVVAFFTVVWAGVRQLRYSEFDVMGGLIFKGAFRRGLERRDQIENLAADLSATKTEDDWWNVLVKLARELKWSRICWAGSHGRREQVFEDRAPAWVFSVPLSDAESVEVAGAVNPASSAFDLVGYAETVARSFAGKRRQWERLVIR